MVPFGSFYITSLPFAPIVHHIQTNRCHCKGNLDAKLKRRQTNVCSGPARLLIIPQGVVTENKHNSSLVTDKSYFSASIKNATGNVREKCDDFTRRGKYQRETKAVLCLQ